MRHYTHNTAEPLFITMFFVSFLCQNCHKQNSHPLYPNLNPCFINKLLFFHFRGCSLLSCCLRRVLKGMTDSYLLCRTTGCLVSSLHISSLCFFILYSLALSVRRLPIHFVDLQKTLDATSTTPLSSHGRLHTNLHAVSETFL